MGQDQRAVKYIRDKRLDLHMAGMGYKTINEKLSKKVTTVTVTTQK